MLFNGFLGSCTAYIAVCRFYAVFFPSSTHCMNEVKLAFPNYSSVIASALVTTMHLIYAPPHA
ncbi:hypothetical protein EDB82DRAFT_507861 [Fusarium venenatum]|uniref:uncharacterized protein n=1 Tax=Fusarium venenatum TaxID=56646 RepID=UPI001D735983|nr:hypothetical protein EDB82DRAFT_507861 [Fusarium venenatum]